MMKKFCIVMGVLISLGLFSSCSSDDEEIYVPQGVNVLLIQSDNGKTSTGMMYGSNEVYNPPHCYLGKEIRYNGGDPFTIYYMSFGANFKGSDVFDLLNIRFESKQPISFYDFKEGDTFDSGQFHASAAYTPTWMEAILIQATALSGKVTVVGTKNEGDKSYIVLRLIDLRFDAIDRSCVYTVNGVVEYEVLK